MAEHRAERAQRTERAALKDVTRQDRGLVPLLAVAAVLTLIRNTEATAKGLVRPI